MGLETKTFGNRTYYYYRYYYRLNGKKNYVEIYEGPTRPDETRLIELQDAYPEVVRAAKKAAPKNIEDKKVEATHSRVEMPDFLL